MRNRKSFDDMTPDEILAAQLKRKPHVQNVGYVCERRNRRTGKGFVVIYDKQAGFDADTKNRWVIVCETHSTLTSMPSLPKARDVMKAVDFCEECMGGVLHAAH